MLYPFDFTLLFGADIRVSVTTDQHSVILVVPESYKSQMCGMCGNYDGNLSEELLMFGGEVSLLEFACQANLRNDRRIIAPNELLKYNVIQ